MADIFLDVGDNFEKAKSSWNKVTKAVSSSNGAFKGATQNTNRMQGALRNMNVDLNRSVNSFSGLNGVLNKLNFAGNFYIFEKLATGLAKAAQSTIDQTEVTNMFEVAMGELAEETYNEIKALSELTGMDLTNIEQAVSTFNTLARSMGMSQQNAKTLSVSTTQLAYDLSSLFNVSFEQVLGDLRSGLIGQTETVYKYGLDLTEASLKQSELGKAMGTSVRNMTQGEKMLVRYDMMLKQANLSTGDFARTIGTPANQLKLLGENAVSLGRAIGSTLYPMLAGILPIIRGVVMALTTLFQLLGAIFGYSVSIPKNVSNGFSDTKEAIDGAAGSAGSLAKELKNIVAPFDELNQVDLTKAAGGGGGAGAGLDTGFALEGLKAYDSLMGNIKDKASEIRDKIMEWLGFTKEVNGATGEFFWKLKDGYTNIEKIRDGIMAVSIAITAVLLAMKLLSLYAGATNLLAKFGFVGLRNNLDLFSAGLRTVGLKETFSTLLPKFTSALPILAGVAAAIAIVAIRLYTASQKSEMFRRGVQVLKDLLLNIKDVFVNLGEYIKGGFLQAWEALKNSAIGDIFRKIEAALAPLNDALSTLDMSVYDLIMGLMPLGDPITKFTNFMKAVGYFTSPAVEQIELFGEAISDVTVEKLKPFIAEMDSMNQYMKEQHWAEKVISQEDVDNISARLNLIVNNITNQLDANKNSALANIELLKPNLTDEMYAQLMGSTNEFFDEFTGTVAEKQAEINGIYAAAAEEHRAITTEEQETINRIMAGMYETGISQLTANEIEYNAIMNSMKNNAVALTVEQASEIIKNAVKTKDETIKAAELQYSGIELEAKNMLKANVIVQSEYDAMIKAAQEAKDETIKSAEEQYETICTTAETKLGELKGLLDTKTGEMKTKWDLFTANLSIAWSTTIDSFSKTLSDGYDKVKEFWNTHLAPKLTLSYWVSKFECIGTALHNVIYGAMNGAVTLVEKGINSMITGLNKFSVTMPEILGGKTIGFNIATVSLPRFAQGGMVDGGLFQAGEGGKYEVVGNYRNKTTVMPLEDTGFVEAMYNAVLSAVTDAGGNGGSVIENIINLDGDVIYTNQQRVSNSRGHNFGMGVFAR